MKPSPGVPVAPLRPGKSGGRYRARAFMVSGSGPAWDRIRELQRILADSRLALPERERDQKFRILWSPGQAVAYTYTAWGGIESVIDPRLGTTFYYYAARRQVQRVVPPGGGATSFGYDTMDDQVTMTNGNGQTWTSTYGVSRLVTSTADPLGNRVSYAYDNNGSRISTTDAKNQTTSFIYDTRDRLVTITDPLNQNTSYQYDAVGNLTRATNARNLAAVFAYDAANRLTQVATLLVRSRHSATMLRATARLCGTGRGRRMRTRMMRPTG